MTALRFLATLMFLIATLALLSDVTPTLYDQASFKATTIEEHWNMLSPKTLSNFKETSSTHLSQNFFERFEKIFFKLPTFFVFGLLGLLMAFLGRRRHKIKIFIN